MRGTAKNSEGALEGRIQGGWEGGERTKTNGACRRGEGIAGGAKE